MDPDGRTDDAKTISLRLRRGIIILMIVVTFFFGFSRPYAENVGKLEGNIINVYGQIQVRMGSLNNRNYCC